MHPADIRYRCSVCNEQLVYEDYDEIDDIIYIQPCENCLEQKEEEDE